MPFPARFSTSRGVLIVKLGSQVELLLNCDSQSANRPPTRFGRWVLRAWNGLTAPRTGRGVLPMRPRLRTLGTCAALTVLGCVVAASTAADDDDFAPLVKDDD